MKGKIKIPLVAVTGTIGSGKSAVCSFLQDRFGFQVLNADLICKRLLEKGEAGWKQFVDQFGPEYLDADGNVDRKRLRLDIFSDAILKNRLEAILHPLARTEMKGQYERLLALGKPVLAEIPLLFEAGWQTEVDRIIVVYAEEGVRFARLCMRDEMSRRQAEEITDCQIPVLMKIMAADHVIDNSGPWCDTVVQLLHLGRIYADFH